MDYLRAFLCGGILCAIGQICIDKTKLTPARILVGYVVAGVLLQAAGVYAPIAEWGGAGATVPLTGFGANLAKGVEKVGKWGVQTLFRLPAAYIIPFPDPEKVRGLMKLVVEQTIEEQGWGPMLEVVREMPCDEDFEKWDTNVRKDFLRKWYHTRSKRVQTVSLEECMEDEDSKIHSLTAPEGDFTGQVEGEDFCQRFKATLSDKDMAILELRVEGYTFEEIADRLGYKTHSAVVKRMEAIKKRFIQYENETGQ